MYQRLNITLPAETVQLLDRAAPKGDRSRYIDQAVRERAARESRKNLRRLIKEGALARYDEDRQMAEDWFFLEEDAWEKARRHKR